MVAVKPPPAMVLNDDSAELKDFISPKNPICWVPMMSALVSRSPVVRSQSIAEAWTKTPKALRRLRQIKI